MSIFNSQRSSEMYLESVSSWREGMKPAETETRVKKGLRGLFFFFFLFYSFRRSDAFQP